jgi:hypothetical protein
MKRYLLVPALLVTLSTGCFTTIGAVAGSSKKTPAGNNDAYAVGQGALVGAVLDAVVIAILLSDGGWIPSERE